MAIFDRVETWRHWIGSPQDLAQILNLARDQIGDFARTRNTESEVHVRVDLYFGRRTVTDTSLDYLVRLRAPDLAQLERAELAVGTAISDPPGRFDRFLTMPRVTLTLENKEKRPALSLRVAGSDETFVEGLTARLREELTKVHIPRGLLVTITEVALFLTIWAATAWAFLAILPTPKGGKVSQIVGAFFFGGMLSIFLISFISKLLLPRLTALELVPPGSKPIYEEYKRSLRISLGALAAGWSIVGSLWTYVGSWPSAQTEVRQAPDRGSDDQ